MTKGARLHNGGKTVSSTNGAGKTGQPHVKDEIRSFLNSTHKNKLKMDKGLNVKLDTIKLLGKHAEHSLT